MKLPLKIIIIFITFLNLSYFLFNKKIYAEENIKLKVIFNKTYGGENSDEAYSIRSKKLGGYIVAGVTTSKKTEDSDFWVLRLNTTGGIIWKKTYGDLNEEKAACINTTTDGGFIVTGTYLPEEDRGSDIWIIKLNEKGDIRWQKKYGQEGAEIPYFIEQTKDNGYIIAGSTTSEGEGGTDLLILKLDRKGNITWKKVLGGGGFDEAHCVHQTTDKGYIVAGSTGSKGAGGVDAWIIKLSSKGKIIWEKTFGGVHTDDVFDIKQTKDGGYIITGYSDSYSTAWRDIWVIKIDKKGIKMWDKVFGGIGIDEGHSIVQTKTGEYVIAGSTTTKGTGFADFWILKINKKGDLIWEQTFGGKGEDRAYSIDLTEDGGYVIAGFTQSRGSGASDFYVIKIQEK